MIRSSLWKTIGAAVLLALAPAPPATAQAAPEPAAAAGLRVYLLTMGQGDLVWEKFGHNALWIHDPAAGTDRVYNYGVFDFDSPGYWGRFVRGNWIYQLAVDDIGRTLAVYQYLNRTLVAQELNLTPVQAAELQAFLEWNARPENREYGYDYYRDNCSTRVRDALDRVLDGRLRAATEQLPSGTTYRWHSRRLIADDPVAYAGMNAGLGPAADRGISLWEEMFLPGKVRERVAELRVPAPGGGTVPLVVGERVLFEATRPAERAATPGWIPAFLAIGVAVGGALALLGRAAARSRAARVGLATLGSLWSLVSGTGGVLLLGLWAFTDHAVAHRNENLLHFDPLSLALVVLVPAAAFGAGRARRVAVALATLVAAVSVLGLLLQALPGFDQVNGETIALLLPAHLGLAWALRRLPPAREGLRLAGYSRTGSLPAGASRFTRR